MANTLSAIMPKILSRGLASLREKCIMPRLVNSDYDTEARGRGDTIDVPVPVAVGTANVAPSSTDVAPTALTPAKVQVPLNHWKQNNPVGLTDKELGNIDRLEHFLPMQLEEAVKALAYDVNADILGQYINTGASQGVYGFVGTAGTTPFAAVTSATSARKVLNEQLCPPADRRGVIDMSAGAAALALAAFSDAEKIMSADVKIEGEIGRKFGVDWVEDHQVPTHTAGTLVDGAAAKTMAIDNGAGYAVGIALINLDEGAATSAVGTIVPGDIISFANHAQTYCVFGTHTAAANAITGLTFYPALTSAVVDNEVMTIKDTHVVNLVFHRDAFAFATRPLISDVQAIGGLGTQMLTMQDPVSGLILRLEVSRQHKQTVWEFDILWGAELVRPQLACRIAG